MRICETVWGPMCDYESTVTCFRCGLRTCKGCSVRIPYLRYGVKRIDLNCLDEMARHGDLDEYVFMQSLVPVTWKEFRELLKGKIRHINVGVIVTGIK